MLVEQKAHRLVPAGWKTADESELVDWNNPDVPEVSVVVPVFNQIATALECLRSVIAASSARIPLELVVVDDASTEAGAERLRQLPGITCYRNPSNVGFVGSCNVGGGLSRGRYLVFLNSDTLVTPGWLEPLLARLEEPGVGIAGACLQYPDGRLQEAGGLVFADASGWNYGRDGHPGDPRYLSCWDAHYCSGAALAVSRERFENLGGFDPLFAPGYYEDTDLAMRIRASGARVVYEPESVVVHLEGASAGTDTSSGMKAAQVVNRGRFLERWRDVLEQAHPPAGTDADLAVREGGANWIVAYLGPDQGDMFLELVDSLVDRRCVVDLFLSAGISLERMRRLRSRGVYVWPPEWGATGRWLLLRQGSVVRAALVDGSAASLEWLRQVRDDLPAARQFRLVAAGASITEAAKDMPAPVTGPDGILAGLDA